MKSALMHRATLIAVPVILCTAWTEVVLAQAPPAPPPPVVVAAPVPPAPPPPAPPAPKWYDKAKIEGFVDAYANVNFNFPKPQTGANLGRAFDVSNGFGLHWAGVNVSYAADPVGAFVGLRFGPGVAIYNGADAGVAGLTNVKEAYASWKPASQFQIDVGKFSTWIGAEVADSQYNMTYTRSILFFTQPAVHTGFRFDYVASDQLDLKLYAVNGYNNSQDNNAGKTFGATVAITPVKDMAFYVNYIGGPEQSDFVPADPGATPPTPPSDVPDADAHWRHLIDVIADMHFDKAHLLINGDFATEKFADGSHSWFGASATLGYAVSDQFAIAARGGYFNDADGITGGLLGLPIPAGAKGSIIDASLTLAAMPTPNLIIKLEPRLDSVSSDAVGFDGIYPKGTNDPPSKTMITTILGVVVTTN